MLTSLTALLWLSLLGALNQVSASVFSFKSLLSPRQQCGGSGADPRNCMGLCASQRVSCTRENDDAELCATSYTRCMSVCQGTNYDQPWGVSSEYMITCDERDTARQQCIQYFIQNSCPNLCQNGNTGSSQGLLECLDGIPQCSPTPAADTHPSSTNKNIPSNKHRQRAAPADSKLKFGR